MEYNDGRALALVLCQQHGWGELTGKVIFIWSVSKSDEARLYELLQTNSVRFVWSSHREARHWPTKLIHQTTELKIISTTTAASSSSGRWELRQLFEVGWEELNFLCHARKSCLFYKKFVPTKSRLKLTSSQIWFLFHELGSPRKT